MRQHEDYLHLGLMEAVPKSGLQRRKIMEFIRSLREHPEPRGDFPLVPKVSAALWERMRVAKLRFGAGRVKMGNAMETVVRGRADRVSSKRAFSKRGARFESETKGSP